MERHLALFRDYLRRRAVWLGALAYFAGASAFHALLVPALPPGTAIEDQFVREAISLAMATCLAVPLVRSLVRPVVTPKRVRLIALIVVVVAAQAAAYALALGLVFVATLLAPGPLALVPSGSEFLFFFPFAATALLPLSVWQTSLACGYGSPGLIGSIRGLWRRQSAYALAFAILMADHVVGQALTPVWFALPRWQATLLTMLPYSLLLAFGIVVSAAVFADIRRSEPSHAATFG